jgi:hypothetical protein
MVSLLVSITLKPLPCMGFLLVILVVKFLKKLIKEEMIELVSKHRYFSIYKVINYEKFNHQNG